MNVRAARQVDGESTSPLTTTPTPESSPLAVTDSPVESETDISKRGESGALSSPRRKITDSRPPWIRRM